MFSGITLGRMVRLGLAVFVAVMPMAAAAASLQVAPTTINIQPGAKAGLLYVSNSGDEPLVAQIEAFDWSQNRKGEELAPSTSVVLSPPMVRLAPGQKQTVRLAIKPDAITGKERAFRLVVSEIPVLAQKKKHDVQMVLQFSVPVFAAGTENTSVPVVWEMADTPQGMTVVAHNAGAQHAKFTKINLVNAAYEIVAPVSDSLSYVLADSTQSWPVALPPVLDSQTLHVQAYDETRGVIIDAPVLAMR